jgi:hypothetical protein
MATAGYDLKTSVDELRKLAAKQRELNDAQTQARRKAWDSHLARVDSPADVQHLLSEIAANPAAW